jgi:undecaprenyl-diphosphatase
MYNTPIERKISMDIQILLFIQENIRHYILTPFFTLITNEYFLYILLGIVLIYMFKKNEDTRRLAKETIIAFLICTLLFVVLKLIFRRPRPFDAFSQLIPLVDKPSDYSFPSGHTASAFICAFMVYDGLPKKYSILVFILAILVAFSRLYVGVHYPTDILAGIVLAYIVYKFMKKTMSTKKYFFYGSIIKTDIKRVNITQKGGLLYVTRSIFYIL